MTSARPKSFLLTTFEGGGTMSPLLTVAKKLIQRGHRVRVLSDACNRSEAEAAGAAFTPWTRAPGKPERTREHDLFHDWNAPTPAEGVKMLIDTVLAGGAAGHAADVTEALAAEPADLVVSSEMLFGVHAACEALQQPLALLAVNIALLPLPGVPPLGPGLTPAQTPADHALHAEIAEAVHSLFDAGLPQLNRVRADLGLPPLARIADQQRAAMRLLLGTSRAFDFAPEELPGHVAYVGPQLGDPDWALPWTPPARSGHGRKLALVAFSTTFQNHTLAVQRVLDAIGALPLDGLATLGGALYAHELTAPAGVTVVDSAPHGEAMAAADLIVTHGGHGTVLKALAAGKPLLILPHGRDQADNAVRVTARGAGLSLPADASTAQIRDALHRLATEPSFAAAAQRLGAEVAREARESPAAEMLEDLACAGRRDTPQYAA